ncbi:MAG TPA: glycosyltransferase family 39 protein [Steroidobacteraceae bacterium]|nr:glycosyltransferase family 39 protein [Steroidobacteraceae bacterium]
MTERVGQIWARPSLLLAFASLVLHGLANGHYGIFRDELYFIVCGDRPDWGYVDQPAVVPLLASWSNAIFGDFLWGFRLLPALAMTATVALTSEFARVVGGGRFAQWLAGSCMLLGPIYLLQGVLFFTDMFQALTWLGLCWVLVRLEQTGNQRWWLAFGAIAGFSLNTKYLIAFYLAALTVGLLATPQRRSLLRPWVYLGALLAGAMVVPNLLWQQAHGWPFIELGKAGSSGKNLEMSPLAFLLQQVIVTGPWATIVWLCGLWAGIVRPRLAVSRALPIAWLILLLVFDASHGKPYYLAAIYPTLAVFGAMRIEEWLGNETARGAVLAGVVVMGTLAAPFTLPILPVDVFIRYQKAVGFVPSTGEHQTLDVLPQYYADMFGWREMAEKVAAVYWSLPAQDRARAVFFGSNYGEAAAIDVFGRRLGLPPAISGHNNYYLWGPRGHDGSVVIIVGGSTEHYAELFDSFEIVGRIDTPYAMPFETDKPIYVLRGMKMPLQDYWPTAKAYQ